MEFNPFFTFINVQGKQEAIRESDIIRIEEYSDHTAIITKTHTVHINEKPSQVTDIILQGMVMVVTALKDAT